MEPKSSTLPLDQEIKFEDIEKNIIFNKGIKRQKRKLKDIPGSKKKKNSFLPDSRNKIKIKSDSIREKGVGPKKGDAVYLDDEEIYLAMNSGNSRFEPKICYRELIVYSWVKALINNDQSKSNVFSRHEATDKILEFAVGQNFPFIHTLHRLIGPDGVRKALIRMRKEGIIEAKIRSKMRNDEIEINTILTVYREKPVIKTFRYFLARSYEGLHRTSKSKRSDEILELIEMKIIPKLIDGNPVLNLTNMKPKVVPYWESDSGIVNFERIFGYIKNYALDFDRLPRDSEFQKWLSSEYQNSHDQFTISSGELKHKLSKIGQHLSRKYHANREHFRNGQHKFLELLNKIFQEITSSEKCPTGLSYIHPKLNGALITRSTIEQSSRNTLFISCDMNGVLADGRPINIITKGSSKQNLAWQTLEQAFLDGIRIIQFIEEDNKSRTSKIISIIIEDTMNLTIDRIRLNIFNMIFHEILKKGAAVPSTRKEFLTQKTLDTAFDRTIKSYEKEGIEFTLWREFLREFFVHFKNLTSDWTLSRDEFEVFWIRFIGKYTVKDS